MIETLNHIISILCIAILFLPLIATFSYHKEKSKSRNQINLTLSIVYLVLFIISIVFNKGAVYLRPLLLISSLLFFYSYKKPTSV
ncbi:hypothetical protein CFB3_46050 [Clostridium folliculivorans]|uniref:Uncharacterized protein n=1 Tax=Clostridium folliculivorans TaxID=2886038 RepID=A0A9W5Y6K5_9CLOT|nr:hypothetical protein CFOLD11_44230 [Clostridium folliculivorans]GKU32497.1 hypothetical protein CFB3_46050 [Clostridium folliculivorans]